MSKTIYDFSSKVAVITGGAGDIGRAAAAMLHEHGARVALLDLDEAGVMAAVAALDDGSLPMALGLRCDVTDPASVDTALDAVIERFGQIDLLFNNAGYQGVFVATDEYPLEDFEAVMKVNVHGAFNVLQATARHMKRRGSGSIVTSASHAGVKGPPNMVAYASSKFAVVGMTQSASKDLAPFGIRVNAISPALIGPGRLWTRQVELQAAAGSQYFPPSTPAVESQMIGTVPLRRLGTLSEVAAGVAFLFSDEASYITGFNLELTGGL